MNDGDDDIVGEAAAAETYRVGIENLLEHSRTSVCVCDCSPHLTAPRREAKGGGGNTPF